MRLTIIVRDGTVIKDNVPYIELDLSGCGVPTDVRALQWFDVSGWIEHRTLPTMPATPNTEINTLPDWANNCVVVWDQMDYRVKNPPPPTADMNKLTASDLLYETDWTTIPDVADPTKSNPYLVNTQDFVDYRNAVRQYAINPVAGNINWPTKPTAVWSS